MNNEDGRPPSTLRLAPGDASSASSAVAANPDKAAFESPDITVGNTGDNSMGNTRENFVGNTGYDSAGNAGDDSVGNTRDIPVPAMGLVLLVGVSGSGKSTFAARHFAPTQVLSSDFCRGLVSDDERDQSASRDAFDVLGYIAAVRLRRGLLTVIDATNVQPAARASLVKLAQDHDALVDAIVFDVPESLAVARDAARTDRQAGAPVITRQQQDLKRSLRHLRREGFRRVHVVTPEEVDAVRIVPTRAWNDQRDLHGPFDIIGDVHGCLPELLDLLEKLGWVVEYEPAAGRDDGTGRVVGGDAAAGLDREASGGGDCGSGRVSGGDAPGVGEDESGAPREGCPRAVNAGQERPDEMPAGGAPREGSPRAVNARHPDGRTAVFVGDLVDRGPAIPGVLRLVMGMVAAGTALCVAGNHEAKLVRLLQQAGVGGARRGKKASPGPAVEPRHGQADSLAQLAAAGPDFSAAALTFMDNLIAHYVLDDGRLVVAHAGLKESYHGRASRRVREFALYGDTTGESDEFGLPVRYPWAQDYRGAATVVYGHTPLVEPEWVNNTICLDTGAVFGGRLTALRYPEREIAQVPAHRQYYAPIRPLAAPTGVGQKAATGVGRRAGGETDPGGQVGIGQTGPTGGDQEAPDSTLLGRNVVLIQAPDPSREPTALRYDDVAGTRWLTTQHAGKVKIAEENAAAALEVMSRFAVDPRWLVYLPPTMSPAPASPREGYPSPRDGNPSPAAIARTGMPPASPREGYLEYPDQAFAEYAAAGVGEVVCEEKHMGSRAIAVVAKDAATAERRFGVADGTTGVVYTRTGRAFFPGLLGEALVDRLRAALGPLFDGLETDWLAVDCELLPWSAKALGLIQDQYAAVGAAAQAALPAAESVLETAAARGLDVAALAGRIARRAANAEAYRRAYAAYIRPTDGLAGVTLAPFQILAAEGRALAVTESHRWHLDQIAHLTDPVITPTRHRYVDLADPSQRDAATTWWLELTEAGGEGIVVKPVGPVEPGRRLQPGLKVRGREYLRIIYGPDYADALDGLRQRSLGRKKSLALREHALGLEALTRFVEGEPLWAVHQLVFAVLALESEPVDPRL